MDWGEILTNVLVVVITVFLPVALGLLLSWLKPVLANWDKKIGEEIGLAQWQFTKALVYQFVEAAEQRGLWDDLLGEGKRKKDWVVDQLDYAFKRYNLTVDWAEIEAAVEEAVYNMNLAKTAVSNGASLELDYTTLESD